MSEEKKDERFYTELVIATIVALVAANAWIDLLQAIIRRWYPNNLLILLIVAVIITGVSIFSLKKLFGRNTKLSSPHIILPHNEEKYVTYCERNQNDSTHHF